MYGTYNRHQQIASVAPTADVTMNTGAIYCGTDGNITLEDSNGDAVTYTVVAGTVLEGNFTKMLFATTTVTNIVGMK